MCGCQEFTTKNILMFFFDYIYLKTYHMMLKVRGDDGTTRFSAFLYTSFILSCLVVIAISIVGLLSDTINPGTVEENVNKLYVYSAVILIGSASLLGIRYYKNKRFDKTEINFKQKSQSQRKLISIVIYFLMVIIPVISFILYRLWYAKSF
jgi:uncharacterized membrane protein